MKRILRTIGKEIERRELEIETLKAARIALAKLVPGHPYNRPKATIARVTKRKHWTQTAAGKVKLAQAVKAGWARRGNKEV